MKFVLPTIFLLTIFGCAVQKDWIPTGGSRSDGIVELSYEEKQFERAVLDESQGWAVATDACIAWGFREARAFGGATQKCSARNSPGSCKDVIITKKYQCID